MDHVCSPPKFSCILVAILIACHLECEARDSINASNPLSHGETIVSAGNRFELGFFSPEGNESSRYVGIWYHQLKPRTVVWVANRNDPILDSCGSFGIKDDGKVGIWCGNEELVLITRLESARTSNRTLHLLDSGNLVLNDTQPGSVSWQSFDYPTDTFLLGMKLNDTIALTSWISPTDPGVGDFTFRQDQGLYVMRNRSVVYWKSGEPGPFKASDGLPVPVIQLLSGLDQKTSPSQVDNPKEWHISVPTESFRYNISRLVMDAAGVINHYILVEGGNWSLVWYEPQDYCSIYNACGKFGICNMETSTVCRCPTGFAPVSSEDWFAGYYSEGCGRKSTKCSETGKFLDVSVINIGGQVAQFDQAVSEEACMEECLKDCDCEAYLFRNHSERASVNSAPVCWIWKKDIVNLHQDDTKGGTNISIRVPSLTTASVDDGDDHPEAPKNKSRKRYAIAIAIPVVVAGVILLSCFSCILYKRRKAKQPENRPSAGAPAVVLFSNDSERRVNDLMQENGKRIDVPFYKLDVILSATDNFSDVNKLGQGGFGPVYKGVFPGGHEIAVKRLSSFSAQGIEEFLNEVVLIAKLQHRNLVRLLGYCIKGNEKILLYEYMPNRSLDAFIFDQHNCLLLDWKKRFEIILGIARGLLYLHQDSRLRIVHRDLKTSNILLDEDMNPKISDFGLARIVEGKGTEASTNKVVGTYGYMSPEYALDGKFSVKSDVFSFGVVVLEIISGRKNTGFYNPHEVLNLLGYAWRLWCDDRALDLIDPTLLESSEESQPTRCINIGLLCVQEDPGERPSMAAVVVMLGSESRTPLPLPTQPAFVVRRGTSATSSSSSTKQGAQRTLSHNEMTISQVQGR